MNNQAVDPATRAVECLRNPQGEYAGAWPPAEVDHFPTGCFVYALLQGADVVYVGVSAGLRSRIRHHSYGDKVFDTWRAWAVPSMQRLQVEEHLIKALQPKYNRPTVVSYV